MGMSIKIATGKSMWYGEAWRSTTSGVGRLASARVVCLRGALESVRHDERLLNRETKREEQVKRVAIHARVSTDEQRPEIQLHGLRAYAEARGLEVTREYVDNGVSGSRDRHPALDDLMLGIRRRRPRR